MMHAYKEIYLNKAQSALGEAFDYAINDCSICGEDFLKMFIVSSISKQMENGDPSIISGKSGVEIAMEVIFETSGKMPNAKPLEYFNQSKEHWIGWAVAYYQWISARSYHTIFSALSFLDLENMYYTLHEADISKFVEIADEKVKKYFKDTNLKRLRTTYGYTQAELSKETGVSLRSIQMYEQRRKDINKASVETIYHLAKELGCQVEDLIEK